MNDPRFTVNLPFEHVPHCACDDGSGPQWTRTEYITRTAACKLRGGPCRRRHLINEQPAKDEKGEPPLL
jgi:hypothetical protein